MFSTLRGFLFTTIFFCFAVSWQITAIKIVQMPININFLLFACFYFSYIEDNSFPSSFLIMFFGAMYDIATSTPLFTNSVILLIISFVLHFYIKPINLLKTISFNGIVLFFAIVFYYILHSICMFFFLPTGVEAADLHIINQILFTLIFYVVIMPCINFIKMLVFR